MFKVVCTISGIRHEYTAEGVWVRAGGEAYATEAEAEEAAKAAKAKFSQRIRHSIHIKAT